MPSASSGSTPAATDLAVAKTGSTPAATDIAVATPDAEVLHEVKLCGHADRIWLDEVATNEFQLTDIITHEKKTLRGDWALVVGDDDLDGRAALVLSHPDEEPQVARSMGGAGWVSTGSV